MPILTWMWAVFVFRQYETAPWSWGKFVDLMEHLWVPIVLLAFGSTAGLIRVMRANMLDELGKPYVETAYAQGIYGTHGCWRYPVRNRANPSLDGRLGASRTVFRRHNRGRRSEPATTGPLLLKALQDAGHVSRWQFHSHSQRLHRHRHVLSEYLLAVSDPRIRMA